VIFLVFKAIFVFLLAPFSEGHLLIELKALLSS
jgi:hypothetical protein